MLDTALKMASTAFGLLPSPVAGAARAAGDAAFGASLSLVESGLLPDAVLRAGIRALLAQRDAQAHVGVEEQAAALQAFVDELKTMPVAVQTDAANEQHYEVPTAYFQAVLGHHLKYSCCLYESPSSTLEEAEVAALALVCERAGLADGQDVLELGCGWGSLSLFMAAKFPGSSILAVSNSRTQKEFIDAAAKERGLANLTVQTHDAAEWTPPAAAFDRVVSVECMEHCKNYAILFRRLASALRPGGRLFTHVFVHATMAYHFEVSDSTDWMTKYFFQGGTMPAFGLLPRFQDDLVLQRQWAVNGTHYSRTLEHWLQRHDSARSDVMAAMAAAYGEPAAHTWFVRWRLFYLACSELFNYKGGNTWFVGHYVFAKREGGCPGAEALGVGDAVGEAAAPAPPAPPAPASQRGGGEGAGLPPVAVRRANGAAPALH